MWLPGLPTTRTGIDNILCASGFLFIVSDYETVFFGCSEENPLAEGCPRDGAILVLAWPAIYGLWILSNYMLFGPASCIFSVCWPTFCFGLWSVGA